MTLPLTAELLRPLLTRAVESVTRAVGASIGVYDSDGGRLVAGAGLADEVDMMQAELGEGPTPAAAATYEVVLSPDLGRDGRWPKLQDAVRAREPTGDAALAAVARPGPWNSRGVTVFSFYLSSSPGEDVLTEIAQHEAPAAIALALIECRDAQQVDQMRELVRSRGVIDQAKGVIMGHVRCTPDEAFDVLRLASQQHNVKVRDLASALVNHVTSESGDARGRDATAQDKVAESVWRSLPRPP